MKYYKKGYHLEFTPVKIKEIREHFGESQERFARRLNVGFVTVWRWETGRSKPSGLAKEKLEKEHASIEVKHGLD